MGAGTHAYTATKGQATSYLVSSSLGAADLVSASCKESGDNYILTIKVKSVKNPARDASNSLGRYSADFKTAAEGKATLEAGMNITLVGLVKPTVESVQIAVAESTITATVNKYTGQAVEIRHSMVGTAELFKVQSPKIMGIEVKIDKASGNNSTDVIFTGFVY
jgi:hypothetical protein